MIVCNIATHRGREAFLQLQGNQNFNFLVQCRTIVAYKHLFILQADICHLSVHNAKLEHHYNCTNCISKSCQKKTFAE